MSWSIESFTIQLSPQIFKGIVHPQIYNWMSLSDQFSILLNCCFNTSPNKEKKEKMLTLWFVESAPCRWSHLGFCSGSVWGLLLSHSGREIPALVFQSSTLWNAWGRYTVVLHIAQIFQVLLQCCAVQYTINEACWEKQIIAASEIAYFELDEVPTAFLVKQYVWVQYIYSIYFCCH